MEYLDLVETYQKTFGPLTETEISHLCYISKIKAFSCGDPVILTEENEKCLYLLKDGTVSVRKMHEVMGSIVVTRLDAGSIFGETSLLNINHHHSYSVVAETDVEVVEIPYASMVPWALNCPELAMKIFKGVALSLSEKLQQTTAVLLDVTRSARLTSLGEMTCGIAHEINSPLTVLTASVGLIEEDLIEKHKDAHGYIQEHCKRMRRSLEYMRKVVQGIRMNSRDTQGDPMASFAIDDALSGSLELCLGRAKNQQVKLVFPKEELGIKVVGRAAQISQVLINLINNALDAVMEVEDRWIQVDVKEEGCAVSISVTDSGRGIAKENMGKVFNPFFTTKPPGKGTGLGLAISRRIAMEHCGALTLRSDLSHTCFELSLPKA